MDSAQDLAFWTTQMEHLFSEKAPKNATDSEAKLASASLAGNDQIPAKPANQQLPKPCRYGNSCTRPDCKFSHPETEAPASEPTKVDIGAKCATLGISWVPSEMSLSLHHSGKLSTKKDEPLPETEELKPEDPVSSTKDYELYGICWAILDPATGKAVNIVATVNVGPTYHSKIASPVSQWYVFNDFSITTIVAAEAMAVHPSWKIPCILFYQAKKMDQGLADINIKNPITAEVFFEDKSLAQRQSGRKRITFIPLSSEEMPQKGDLVAIDAEFVTLNQEESELRSDCKVSNIKAAQMSLARITCVRGNGVMEGTPFIDDYISTQEQVVDYVTKFSGIKPGDLDANFSSKHLTTLKSTYKKLRYLIDLGVMFIGHGLKNDFKVINVVVPPEQVIDTVHLFHLPHHRMVSLKFLAWYFLNEKIQGITHDSIVSQY
jgi:PAB-dependent poly(A)-specific ribonuclease subunit 2